ncbi:glutaminase [Capnocytophaga sputigena]|uniref:glutaminase n=1 Tax=Capnocytophaga sputigena TaxID=1019 RepID=UPI0028E1C648|nr:glutaminase [Capnocytophaga sputigena]
MKYSKIIDAVYEEVLKGENTGTVPTYIPELAQVNPEQFGVYFYSLNKQSYGIGDCDVKFSAQSIAKVLALSLAYSIIGDQLWKRVDVEPSGTSFNSLVQLEADNGIPRNPLINAGAIVVCDILLSILEDAEADFLTFVRELANDDSINYSILVAESEKSVGYRNFALCYYIKSLGNIENDPIEVLNFYFKLCSLELTCKSMAYIFSFLANDGIRMHDRVQILTETCTKRVNAIMQTCGFYDESGEFAFKVGLPGKSGVGGGIVALLPNHYSIAVWSPKLNDKGNSYRGMKFLEMFTAQTHTSIF